MKEKKIPMRMCIACHEMKPKKEMLRIVKPKDGEVSIDFTGKAAGRGAYICDNSECIKKLRKARLLNKVFFRGDPAGSVRQNRGGVFCRKKVKRKAISGSVSRRAS